MSLVDGSVRAAPGPVVVGYDASEIAEAALVWAAGEARLRGAALQVVYVRDADDIGPAVRSGGRELASEGGAWPVVEEAAARARDVAPGVETETYVQYASPVAALVGMSRDAGLIVLGSSPRGALRDELRGSVETQVAAHAHCPVALVPLPTVPPSDRVAGAADPPVVVGYDGSDAAALALTYAADAAWFGGRPLRVVVAWRPGPAEWLESFATGSLPRDATEAAAEVTLADALDRVYQHHRSVGRSPASDQPDGVVAEGRAVDVLYREAVTAERLVIGTRGRGGFAALLLGSVTHTLVRAAPCPVVAVRATG